MFRAFGGAGRRAGRRRSASTSRARSTIDEADLDALAARCAATPSAPALMRLPRGGGALLFRADGAAGRAALPHHARSARARRRARSDARRDAPRRRRRRDGRAADHGGDGRRLGGPLGPASPTPRSRSRSTPSGPGRRSSRRWRGSPTAGADGARAVRGSERPMVAHRDPVARGASSSIGSGAGRRLDEVLSAVVVGSDTSPASAVPPSAQKACAT